MAKPDVRRQGPGRRWQARRGDSVRAGLERAERASDGHCAFCEGVLLDSGFADEAYARYAVEATYAATNLATFKAIVKKHPGKPRETILRDLVASQPGQEGKWFAAAKDAGFFELAIEQANRKPCSPEDADTRRQGLRGGTAGVCAGGRHDWTAWYRQWLGLRHHRYRRADAYAAVMAAVGAAGVDETVVKANVRVIIAASRGGGEFVGRVLARQLEG